VNTNYVLIDFENVQPESLQLLTAEQFKVVLFVGASQTWIPFELAASLQPFGSRAQYVKISGNGRNALDFHIAYYIGRLATTEPTAQFHVISKDAGYDPLIDHLRSQHIQARRVCDVTEITGGSSTGTAAVERTVSRAIQSVSPTTAQRVAPPTVSPAAPVSVLKPVAVTVDTRKGGPVAEPKISKSTQDRIDMIVTRLRSMTKPKTVKTLSSTISAMFAKQISSQEVNSLIQGMVSRGYLKLTNNNTSVAYSLPTAV